MSSRRVLNEVREWNMSQVFVCRLAVVSARLGDSFLLDSASSSVDSSSRTSRRKARRTRDRRRPNSRLSRMEMAMQRRMGIAAAEMRTPRTAPMETVTWPSRQEAMMR